LSAGGFFRLAVPRRFGGLEADARTLIEVCARLARGCGSSSWIVNIVAGASFIAARFSDEAREDIWGADPGAVVCATLTPTGTARSTEDGLLVEGSWQFASGIHHAQWVIAGVQVLDQGGEPVGVELVLLPVGELEVQLTWQVAGMKGTGSDSYTAAGVLVPRHRTLSMAELFAGGHASSRPEEPRYTGALSGYLALPLLGPILGLAQAALELTHERLSKGEPLSVSLYPSASSNSGWIPRFHRRRRRSPAPARPRG
jgi:3-hydroxy-9,10-secoandrosta-1,3,5(10)-triene-9,17-dione monooxygenase